MAEPGRGGTAMTEAARVLLIIPYFGRFGPWFPLYLHSLSRQRRLDLLLVSDRLDHELPANARHMPMSLAELRERAADILQTPVAAGSALKLCDLRPAWGLIFADQLRGYRYWAYGDEDVLYGDLDRFIAPALDAGSDLIVPSRQATIGHLTIIRNAPLTNRLLLDDAEWRAVLASPDHWAYDEWSQHRPAGTGSFTRTVNAAEAAGRLRVAWGVPKRGDLPRHGRSYVYDGLALRDDEGAETAYYHWGRFKHVHRRFPAAEPAPPVFAFDRHGFYRHDLRGVRLGARRVAARQQEWTGRALTRLGQVLASLL